MPKKRSIVKGFTKGLQRLYSRAGRGPALPEPESKHASPDAPTAVPATPKGPADIARLQAAQAKRQRRAARLIRES